MSSAMELAKELAEAPTKAIAAIKRAITESLTMDLDTSLDYSQGFLYQLSKTEDHKEAVRAFLEKRKAQFKGK